MAETKLGFIKWFRGDGTGYIIEDGCNDDDSVYVDKASVKNSSKTNEDVDLKKGQKVKFKSRIIFGRKVAVDVEPI